MSTERLNENDRPFEFLGHPGHEKVTEDKGNQLKLLGLSFDSTAIEARGTALIMRDQMRAVGLNVETVKALRWVLEQTHDCLNPYQFLWFLLEGQSFEQIEEMRDF